MAYNILKGTVEFSDTSGSIENIVNTWQAQTIDGNKVFTQTLSASAFRDNTGILTSGAITSIASDGANRVITSDGDGTATAHANVTIVGSALTASFFSGSGVGLTSLRAQEIINKLSASQIHIGNGLVAASENITVSGSDGISVSATGVTLDLLASHGLVFSGSSRELAIDPSNPAAITDGGQTLADADSFVVYDQSRAQTRKATAINIYSYISSKLTAPAITSYTNAGDNRIVTSVNSNTVNAEANLTFDGTDLLIAGNISGSGTAQIGGNLTSSNIVPNVTLTNNLGSLDLEWSRLYVEEVIGDIQGAIRFDAINDEGDSISRGQVVYIKGVTGQTPTVALAAADDATKMPAFGLAGSNAAQGASVEVITFGSIGNLNLGTLFPDETFAEGDPVFVQTGSGGVSGSMTTTRPTGSNNLLQNIGQVVRNGGGGDSQIKVGGAGRSNATPNLDKGYLFVGNDSDCSVQDNTIYVSSSANRVGINTIPLDSTLEVNGTTAVSGNVNIRLNNQFFQGYSTTNSNVSLIGVYSDDVIHVGNLGYDISLRDDTFVQGNISGSGGLSAGTFISSSLGIHVTGSQPHIAIGDKFGGAALDGMLAIRPSDTSNKTLALMQAAEADGGRIALGVSGSGHITVGGAAFDGVLNVSGSDIEKLIHAQSDSHNPVFQVSGSGEVIIGSNTPTLTLNDGATAAASIGVNAGDNLVIENFATNRNIVFFVDKAGSQKEALRLNGGISEVVVNEGSDGLLDFRVESDNNTHMLYVSGSNDRVAIGASDPEVTLDVNGNAVRIRTSSTPSSASDFGVAGEIRWDANYIYVCVATDTWKRVAISTW